MEHKTHRIKEVVRYGIAEELGVEAGDILLSINGCEVNDVIDYRYLTKEEYIEVLIRKPRGEEWLLEIEKDIDEDLGMVFEPEMMDKSRGCRNKCVFCFIDQLPGGLRKSLYFKDDDIRLSFLQGNFVTLTNLKEDDIKRIIDYRISPLNVSVHTTDPQLRVKMLGNPEAARIMGLLDLFTRHRIHFNCQIVLCPGINDKHHLDRTLEDLGRLWPGVRSIGVVPVGLTRFRKGLQRIIPCDDGLCRNTIRQIEKWQKRYMAEKGTRLVYAADEFYLRAGMPVPDADEYEGFPQLENGIGLMALFREEFDSLFSKLDKINVKRHLSAVVATGTAARHFMEELANKVSGKFPGIRIKVFPVKNDFFGHNVDVAGLVTGRDLISQLKNNALGDVLFIPEDMLKSGERIFLDDVTVEDVSQELKVRVDVCPVDGRVFLKKILGEERS